MAAAKGAGGSLRDVSRHPFQRRAAGLGDLRDRPASRIGDRRSRSGVADRHEPSGPRHARVTDERRASCRDRGRRPFTFALGNSNASALAAGLASSGAILIRPNLAPSGGDSGCLEIVGRAKALRTAPRVSVAKTPVAQAFRPVSLMIAGTIPGCLFIAWINNTLYGSPLASGYGSLSDLFSIGHVLHESAALRRLADRKPDAVGVARHRGAARFLSSLSVRSGRRHRNSAAPSFSARSVVIGVGALLDHTRRTTPGGFSDSCSRAGRLSASEPQPSSCASRRIRRLVAARSRHRHHPLLLAFTASTSLCETARSHPERAIIGTSASRSSSSRRPILPLSFSPDKIAGRSDTTPAVRS